MRRTIPFLTFLAVLSIISGWLMSRMSWIGRVGVNLFHKEYKFLKVWYQGAATVFGIWLVLFLLQALMQRRFSKSSGRVMHLIAFLLAVLGLYATYNDFQTDFTHGLMKERFHLGLYLFWFGWMAISLFFLTARKVSKVETTTRVDVTRVTSTGKNP